MMGIVWEFIKRYWWKILLAIILFVGTLGIYYVYKAKKNAEGA